MCESDSPHCDAQELSQRALVSYLRSVFLQPNRAVFDVSALPVSPSHSRRSQNLCTTLSYVTGHWLCPSSTCALGL